MTLTINEEDCIKECYQIEFFLHYHELLYISIVVTILDPLVVLKYCLLETFLLKTMTAWFCCGNECKE